MEYPTTYHGIEIDWNLPRIKTGDYVRFFYWNSDFTDYRGVRCRIVKIRHLSAKPLLQKSKDSYDIIRGNALVLVSIRYRGQYVVRAYYNHRMSNLEFTEKR